MSKVYIFSINDGHIGGGNAGRVTGSSNIRDENFSSIGTIQGLGRNATFNRLAKKGTHLI